MMKETDKEGNTKYQYGKCPACGSKKRHYEDMCEKAIKAELAQPGFLVPYNYNSRVIADKLKLDAAPLGSEVPSIASATEICKDCGCVYAPMVITGKAKKTLTPPKIILPGQK